MSYIDHQAREINVKVVWLANGEHDVPALEAAFWRLRSKPKTTRLKLDDGEVLIVAMRLPPYPKLSGYHLRFHLHHQAGSADPLIWKGADAAVAAADEDVPASLVRVERSPDDDVKTVARRLVSAVLERLETPASDDASPPHDDDPEYVDVGPFPFLVNLEGLEPHLDTDEHRTRLSVETPNGYDLIVVAHPTEARTADEVLEQAAEAWGAPERHDDELVGGFPFARRVFRPDGESTRLELLAADLRDWTMTITLREAEDADAVEELRRYFLVMVESAILRSSENRP